jgi:broad specificity phosphatase PhoE
MSTLYLIRHGQASHGAKDYDVLSPIGAEQSHRLGGFLAARGAALDALYAGPLRRQRDSAEHVRRGLALAGERLETRIEAALAEYPAHAVIRAFAPVFAQGDVLLDALVSSNDGRGIAESVDRAALQRLFERVISSWATSDRAGDGIERFSEFRARVVESLGGILTRHGRGQRVAVVTSGGVVAAVVAHVLGLDVRRALELSWVLNNASVTELKWREDASMTGGAALARASLTRFNVVSHLDEARLLTLV